MIIVCLHWKQRNALKTLWLGGNGLTYSDQVKSWCIKDIRMLFWEESFYYNRPFCNMNILKLSHVQINAMIFTPEEL